VYVKKAGQVPKAVQVAKAGPDTETFRCRADGAHQLGVDQLIGVSSAVRGVIPFSFA
jgi:hypothetical protein